MYKKIKHSWTLVKLGNPHIHNVPAAQRNVERAVSAIALSPHYVIFDLRYNLSSEYYVQNIKIYMQPKSWCHVGPQFSLKNVSRFSILQPARTSLLSNFGILAFYISVRSHQCLRKVRKWLPSMTFPVCLTAILHVKHLESWLVIHAIVKAEFKDIYPVFF